jgi:hypothetical protein
MRPRDEVLLAVVTLAVLGGIAGWLGRTRRTAVSQDTRPSTFLAGPGGARALLESLQRLGISVRRFRLRPRELPSLQDSIRQALVVLDPSYDFSPPELSAVLAFGRTADLILAGENANNLMRCFGYQVRRRMIDSVQVSPPRQALGPASPWVRAALRPTNRATVVDSSRAMDVAYTTCTVPAMKRIDTLLVSATRQPAVLRLHRADVDQRVILVADADLFTNRALRRDDEAGPFVLLLVRGEYDRVVFEEYHHGFGAAGSLAGAVLAWSRKSPWGWAVWQAAAVGLLALLFGAIRFGLPRPAISRTRRSPLEHVRALATALASAKGHDVAIAAIVRGLRRRLLPPALRARGNWRHWLARLGESTRSARAREALTKLESLTRPGQPSTAVLRAAHAVEDLWEDQRH